MTLRLFAFGLALLFAATAVVGVVCQMNCDQMPRSAACHEPTSSGGPSVRSTHHPCDHDHTGGSFARGAGTAGARDSIGTASIFIEVIARVTAPLARPAITDVHGPPGPAGRRVSSRTTILRI